MRLKFDFLTVAGLGIFACTGSACSDSTAPGPASPGALEVTVATTGSIAAGEPYQLFIQLRGGVESTQANISRNGSATFAQLPGGEYVVVLRNVPPGCEVSPVSRSVLVGSGQASSIAFSVTCLAIAELAVVRYHDDIGDLGLVKGAFEILLTADGFNKQPAWSPDGKKIAFVRELFSGGSPAATQIYVMDADGGHLAQVSDDPAGANHPTWSPDGKRIAFSKGAGLSAIYVMNSDGSDVVRITDQDAYTQPAWSPDGARIAFASGMSGASGIWVLTLEGSHLERVTSGSDNSPAWSPDGNRIAFQREETIFVTNVDGTALTALANYIFPAGNPSWSPDGTRIAFDSLSCTPDWYLGFDGTCEYTVHIVGTDGIPAAGIWYNASEPAWRPR